MNFKALLIFSNSVTDGAIGPALLNKEHTQEVRHCNYDPLQTASGQLALTRATV
jgi:hypothetical protein